MMKVNNYTMHLTYAKS